MVFRVVDSYPPRSTVTRYTDPFFTPQKPKGMRIQEARDIAIYLQEVVITGPNVSIHRKPTVFLLHSSDSFQPFTRAVLAPRQGSSMNSGCASAL